MKFEMSFPDPLYGHIRVTHLERIIIDLPEFQRLKRIKQLGVASIVFSGAQHTRFEHCLGTMHISDLIYERIKADFDEEDHQKVRIAGLLHDVGHAPFSHTFELALKMMNLNIKFFHEENTKKICEKISLSKKKDEMSQFITGDLNSYFKTIGKIATGDKEGLSSKDKFLSSIISGEIDADRIDYLLRDSLHTGVHFIGFKLSLLLESISRNEERFELIIGKQGEYRAFHERMAIAIAEAFLISRYHHYEYIVNHPRNISANLIFVKAFENSLIRLKNKDPVLYDIELNRFFNECDDQDLINFIYKHGDQQAIDLINNYKNGMILKHIFDLKSFALLPKI